MDDLDARRYRQDSVGSDNCLAVERRAMAMHRNKRHKAGELIRNQHSGEVAIIVGCIQPDHSYLKEQLLMLKNGGELTTIQLIFIDAFWLRQI